MRSVVSNQAAGMSGVGEDGEALEAGVDAAAADPMPRLIEL
jgi:hypothetical protein